MKPVCVGAASVNQTPLDWENNLNHILAAVQAARQAGVAILCLPELAISGYGCEDAFFSDYVLAESLQSLTQIMAATEGILLTVGLPILHENCLYNCQAVVQNGNLLGLVAKQTLAGDGVYYEPRWFKPWEDGRLSSYNWQGKPYPIGDMVFEVDGLRLALEICEDAWNGVRPAQRHYLNNVDLMLNPSASHFAFGKSAIRQKIVQETSRSYACTYVYSNLVGNEAGRLIFDGELLIAQQGELLARAQRFGYKDFYLVTATVEPGLSRRQRKKSFSFRPALTAFTVKGADLLPLATLQPAAPVAALESKEEEFYLAETLALFDYLRKSGSRGFVLSLSGGADSSATAVLAQQCWQRAQDELGWDGLQAKLNHMPYLREETLAALMLTCVYQATPNSGPATQASAAALAHGLAATYHYWDVSAPLAAYQQLAEQALQRPLSWQTDDVPLQNIQARVRAPGVWLLTNLLGALLLTTSNRSEAAVGYATMDGDTAGGLAPLGGIDKNFLLHWLRWAEVNLNLPSLRMVNSLQPTAELRPAERVQTDENDLMPYPVLDQIERCAIRDYKSPTETFLTLRGIATDETLRGWIHKFYRLWAQNQWKRERYAPSFHLDDENLDPRTWCRFPILSGGYRKELAALDDLLASLASSSVV